MAKILILDDDASLLQMITIILTRAGYQTIVSTDPEEGYNMAVNERPDLAILDVMMPMVNGYQVCTALRKNEVTKNIPVLMLTALTEAEHRERAEDAGADGFVTKPISSGELVKAINDVMQSHGH